MMRPIAPFLIGLALSVSIGVAQSTVSTPIVGFVKTDASPSSDTMIAPGYAPG